MLLIQPFPGITIRLGIQLKENKINLKKKALNK